MIKRKEIEVDSSCPKATSNTVTLVEDDCLSVNTLQRGVIPVAFEIDDEVKVGKTYPETLISSNANMPTLYELMSEPSIETWEDLPDNKPELGNEWHLHVDRKSKKNKSHLQRST